MTAWRIMSGGIIWCCEDCERTYYRPRDEEEASEIPIVVRLCRQEKKLSFFDRMMAWLKRDEHCP